MLQGCRLSAGLRVRVCPTTLPYQLATLHVQVYYSTFLGRDPSSKTFDSFPEIDSVDALPVCYFGQNTRLYPKPPNTGSGRYQRIFPPGSTAVPRKPFPRAPDPRRQSFRVNQFIQGFSWDKGQQYLMVK